jgi:hypothetical protein
MKKMVAWPMWCASAVANTISKTRPYAGHTCSSQSNGKSTRTPAAATTTPMRSRTAHKFRRSRAGRAVDDSVGAGMSPSSIIAPRYTRHPLARRSGQIVGCHSGVRRQDRRREWRRGGRAKKVGAHRCDQRIPPHTAPDCGRHEHDKNDSIARAPPLGRGRESLRPRQRAGGQARTRCGAPWAGSPEPWPRPQRIRLVFPDPCSVRDRRPRSRPGFGPLQPTWR